MRHGGVKLPLVLGGGRVDVRFALFAALLAAVALLLALHLHIRLQIQLTCDESGHSTAARPLNPMETAALHAALVARWDHWPYGPRGHPHVDPAHLPPLSSIRVGIVTGGSSDLFGGTPGAYGDATTCLLRMYAERKGYAFYSERALQRMGSDRPVAWQKVKLMQRRLSDVDLLVWVDADVAWLAPEVDLAKLFFHELHNHSACTGHLGQPHWGAKAGHLADKPGAAGIYAWTSADVRGKQQRNMNLNSAVMALRSGGQARRFLELVWKEGNDPESFKRHNPNWDRQSPGHHYWGWPFEQGGIWSVLDRDEGLLRGMCVVKVGLLHSVEYKRWHPHGALSAHMPGMPPVDRRRAACSHLGQALKGQGACAWALPRCPDLFAGRLMAEHAAEICKHCHAPGSNASSFWGQGLSCACLRGEEDKRPGMPKGYH